VLQYFPDRGKAVKEMARVLVPGGRLALNVWGPLQRAVFLVSLVEKVGHFLGAEAMQPFNQGYSLNTCEELRSLASAAGFSEFHVRIEHRTVRYPNVEEYALGFLSMTPIAALVQALPDDEKAQLASQVHADMATWIDDDGLAAVHENHFLTATR
jgi:SAM-dependent methyltransferase